MSSKDINLLATSPVSHDKEKRLKQVRILALIFIFIVGLMSVLTFILNISSPLDQIKKQESDVLSQIVAQQDKAAKLAIVGERGATISKILNNRPDYSNILSMVLAKTNDKVNTAGLDIGESSVTISVTSASLLDLNNFLNSVIDGAKQDSKISSVFLDSLSVSQTSGRYTMGVKINLKNE